ncbi:MAG: hypothetical protein WC582_01440 [Patescibacteria group bacterium]
MRDSQTAIIRLKRKVLKIPLSFSACKEIIREKKNFPEVLRDSHFSKFFLKGCFLGGIILCNPYLRPAKRESGDIDLIKKYFKMSFRDFRDWEIKKIKEIIEYKYFLDFVFENIAEDQSFWSDYLLRIGIPCSSSHGDFHLDNILLKDNNLFFIDWIRYRKFSSRLFDLIDFYIFYNKNSSQSWMDFWFEEFRLDREIIYDIEIEKNYFLAYAVWKVSEELKTLVLRGKLSKQKRKKYINFLKEIKNNLNE